MILNIIMFIIKKKKKGGDCSRIILEMVWKQLGQIIHGYEQLLLIYSVLFWTYLS